MLFSSTFFLYYFFAVLLAVYFIIPRRFLSVRNLVLLVASLIFYSWGEPVYVILMLYSSFFNWYMGLEISREKRNGGTGRRNLLFTIIVNLFLLGFFKYFGFFMDTVNQIAGSDIRYTALALPIGISFYTFQALSYIFDVYRGTVPAQRNYLKFALYLSFFPQLIAGPIVKYRDIERELTDRRTTLKDFGEGAERFIIGLGKKVLLANAFGALHTSILALDASEASVLTWWIGALAYTLQIYFDFSGYSDMAIGLGRIFGFHFMENFNYPYISKTVTEFWRRWHISLSSWFREYVYIPLGGNRVPVWRHILNLLIVWSLTGLWHGAAWNFVFWGLYYGILLIIEKYLLQGVLDRLPSAALHIYTMVIVMVGWVFFFSNGLGAAQEYLKVMFGLGHAAFVNMKTIYLLRTNGLLLLLGIFLAGPGPYRMFRALVTGRGVTGGIRGAVGTCLLAVVLLLATASLVYSGYNPFLYFRF